MTDDTSLSGWESDRGPGSGEGSDTQPKLSRALGREFGPEPEIPACVDAAILARAHEQLRATRPVRARLIRVPDRLWRWVPAAAAAAVLALVLWPRATKHSGLDDVVRAPAPATVMDIDSNGRVDIRDGFALARRIQSGAALQPEWDVDGDGAVTRADVDRIAHVAVRLDGRSR